jgi:ADP-ribosylglycohydrolase
MRAAPIGLMFWDDAQRLVASACDQGSITHRDPRCCAGAVAVAGTVALAVRHEVDLPVWTGQLARWVEGLDRVLADGILRLVDLVEQPPEAALPVISRLGLTGDYDNGWEGITPFVTSSVLWSLYSFFREPDDYWATISTAIAVGGDVDTTAAMAGAISGAYLGLDALPLQHASRLTDRGTWGLSDLVALAHGCHALKHGAERT